MFPLLLFALASVVRVGAATPLSDGGACTEDQAAALGLAQCDASSVSEQRSMLQKRAVRRDLQVEPETDKASSDSLSQHAAAVHARVQGRVVERLASDSNIVKASFDAAGVQLETQHVSLLETMTHANMSQRITWDPLDPQYYANLANPSDSVVKLRRNLAMKAMAMGFANLITKLSGPNPHFSFKEVIGTVFSIINPLVGYINPLLGIALTFATSLIQGILGNQEESPLQKLYKRIMKEVKDFVSDSMIRERLQNFKTELAAVNKEMQLMNDIISLEKHAGGGKLSKEMVQSQTIWYMILLKDVSELRMKFWGADCSKSMKNEKCRKWHKMCIWNDAIHITNLELAIVSQLILFEPRWGVTLGHRMVEIAKQAVKSIRVSVDACKESRSSHFTDSKGYQDKFYSPPKHFGTFKAYLDQVKLIASKLQDTADQYEEHYLGMLVASTKDNSKLRLGKGRIFEANLGTKKERPHDNFWLIAGKDELLRGMWINDVGPNNWAHMGDLKLLSSRKVTGSGGKFTCSDNWHWLGFDGGWGGWSKWMYQSHMTRHVGCNPGMFVRGWYKGNGAGLETLEATKCCKPVGAPHQWGSCEYKTVFDLRNNMKARQQWHECPAGTMLAGLDRIRAGDGQGLYPLFRLKCCSLSYCPAECKAANPVITAVRSCKTCVDPKTKKCVKDGEECPVGSVSCQSCGKEISSGCAAKIYRYPDFKHGNWHHSTYLTKSKSYLELYSKPQLWVPQWYVKSLKVEGSDGCQVKIYEGVYQRKWTMLQSQVTRGLGEYSEGEMKYEDKERSKWRLVRPKHIYLTLQCSVIIYQGGGLTKPLPRLPPGLYSQQELQQMGWMGTIAGFKIEKKDTNKNCVFRILDKKGHLLHGEWKGPYESRSGWGGATPETLEVGLWDR